MLSTYPVLGAPLGRQEQEPQGDRAPQRPLGRVLDLGRCVTLDS